MYDYFCHFFNPLPCELIEVDEKQKAFTTERAERDPETTEEILGF
jgi:hypothetical protein